MWRRIGGLSLVLGLVVLLSCVLLGWLSVPGYVAPPSWWMGRSGASSGVGQGSWSLGSWAGSASSASSSSGLSVVSVRLLADVTPSPSEPVPSGEGAGTASPSPTTMVPDTTPSTASTTATTATTGPSVVTSPTGPSLATTGEPSPWESDRDSALIVGLALLVLLVSLHVVGSWGSR